jgi:hypothetical protein
MFVTESDNKALFDILELLYKRISDDLASPGTDRAILQATLQISPKQIDDNMSYLADRNLVILAGTTNGKWTFAKITAEGIDVVENKERHGGKIPSGQGSSQIQEEPQEKGFLKGQPQFSFPELVSNAFKQASDQVLNAKISTGEKGKIEKQLKSLEKELLKTKKADLREIQKDWEWLKKNADWVSTTLASVVLEGIRIALDLPILSEP